MSDEAQPGTLVTDGAAAATIDIAVPHTVRRTRRRRPSGAPPPLPRHIGASGKGLLVGAGLLLAWVAVAYVSPAARRVTDRTDAALLRGLADLRTPWLTSTLDVVWPCRTRSTCWSPFCSRSGSRSTPSGSSRPARRSR